MRRATQNAHLRPNHIPKELIIFGEAIPLPQHANQSSPQLLTIKSTLLITPPNYSFNIKHS